MWVAGNRCGVVGRSPWTPFEFNSQMSLLVRRAAVLTAALASLDFSLSKIDIRNMLYVDGIDIAAVLKNAGLDSSSDPDAQKNTHGLLFEQGVRNVPLFCLCLKFYLRLDRVTGLMLLIEKMGQKEVSMSATLHFEMATRDEYPRSCPIRRETRPGDREFRDLHFDHEDLDLHNADALNPYIEEKAEHYANILEALGYFTGSPIRFVVGPGISSVVVDSRGHLMIPKMMVRRKAEAPAQGEWQARNVYGTNIHQFATNGFAAT
jgi:hypothetical protein